MEKWFVIFCQVNSDEVAEMNLKNQGFSTYRPLIQRNVKGRNQFVSMFPRYIFVKQLEVEPLNFRKINYTRGVNKLVAFGPSPPFLTNEKIERIRRLEKVSSESGFDKKYKNGDLVHVELSAGTISAATFLAYSGASRVSVLIDILGRKIGALLDESKLVSS